MLKQKSSRINRFSAATNRHQRVFVDNGSGNGALPAEYATRLNFYSHPPPAEITIEEFETYALDRLQVLKTLETASLRNKHGPEYKKQVDQALEKHLPLKSNMSRSPTLLEERRKDHISHFVLRLAYCRSEDLRAWFLRQECALFKFRFEQESLEEKKNFVSSLNLSWSIVEHAEKDQLLDKLAACTVWKAGKTAQAARDMVNNETYFKVDFEKVPDLIGRRAVYMAQGKAYVPMSEQISIVMDEFRAKLLAALEATSKALPRMEEDDRLKPILLNVEKQYIGKDYGTSANVNGSVRASDVDQLVHLHAPLCMKHMHSSLRADKHLRHGGRMQYGLFLKAIGLTVEEALVFWRTAFSNITDDKFQKEYSYNIRHNYGLEGRRVSYAPYNCMKIISGNPPSTGDHHGCPFRHFSQNNLESKLYSERIGTVNVNEIMNLVRDRHYQVACTRYFEVSHAQKGETTATTTANKIDTIEHPNQYYETSKRLANESLAPNNNNGDAMDIDR
ncbi:DNA primase large subunit Spp2 [Zychaea mexicana]|uniref:DNA primase large subunit Spp2 n=1 Tax=Zychaea mexicana TaxID=64656 RepID=UPI0022FEE633|nr:DNA primase large subunit Spp2 [Zychaea mexicana]KAI9493481.1 DNA primase large subunit Spp2 [Zychaea mexicana]